MLFYTRQRPTTSPSLFYDYSRLLFLLLVIVISQVLANHELLFSAPHRSERPWFRVLMRIVFIAEWSLLQSIPTRNASASWCAGDWGPACLSGCGMPWKKLLLHLWPFPGSDALLQLLSPPVMKKGFFVIPKRIVYHTNVHVCVGYAWGVGAAHPCFYLQYCTVHFEGLLEFSLP